MKQELVQCSLCPLVLEVGACWSLLGREGWKKVLGNFKAPVCRKEPDTAGCVNAVSLMLIVNEDESAWKEACRICCVWPTCDKVPCLPA